MTVLSSYSCMRLFTAAAIFENGNIVLGKYANIFHDISFSNIQEKSKLCLTSFIYRHFRLNLVVHFKIVSVHSDTAKNTIFFYFNRCNLSRPHRFQLFQRDLTLNSVQNFFPLQIFRVSNKLSIDVVSAPSVLTFPGRRKRYNPGNISYFAQEIKIQQTQQ